MCASNLWLGTGIRMVGYKAVQCSFKRDIIISDTEAVKDYSKKSFEKPLWLFVNKGPKCFGLFFFIYLKLFFFFYFAKQDKSV